MKPPMNEFVVVKNPVKDEQGRLIKDSFGRYKLTSDTVEGRVQKTTKVIRGTDGQQYQTSLEVDLPPETEVSNLSGIEYIDQFGVLTKGKVIAINESTNLAGNKVYFRTVNVG